MIQPKKSVTYPEESLLVSAAQSIWGGSTASITISITPSSSFKAKLYEILGSTIESIFITDSDIRHIMKTHGRDESLRGQVDINPGDFSTIPLILNEFDGITLSNPDKLGNKRLLITKNIGDTAYIATVQRGKKKLEIKTFWKRKMSGASC